MRLTLRTLLAYLDDVLEPTQTKEIGQKIQESPVAAALVSRVREVIRRRRLGAPEVQSQGTGIDPNVIAQYLDNTLPPERVADVERVCLESDVYLAEVAACHEILSLVLGEPVEIPQTQLERFYVLGPITADAQLKPAEELPRSQPAAAVSPPVLSPERSFNESLPDYLKPAPWSQRFLPMAGMAVLLIAAVLALALDPAFTRTMMGLQPAEPPGPNVVQGDSSAKPANIPAPASNQNEGAPAPGTVVADAGSGRNSPAIQLPPGIDPAPPADMPDPQTPAVPPTELAPVGTVAPRIPLVPEPASALDNAPVSAVMPAAPEAVAVIPEPPAAPPPEPRMPAEPRERVFVPMQYTSTEGILMRLEDMDAHWYVQPRRSELHPEEVFASPEPFEATLDLDAGQIAATMLGDTVIQILPPTVQRRVQLELRRGRLILARGPAAPTDQPVMLSLAAGTRIWQVELTTPATTVALEKQFVSPTGLPLPAEGQRSRVAAIAVNGAVVFSTDMAEPLSLAAGQMRWLSVPDGESPPELTSLPDWVDAERRRSSVALKRYTTLFEREFDEKASVDLSIPALVADSRPKISELATRTLGTIENMPELIKVLARSAHAESRMAAADGIRAWLIQDPARSDQLKEQLKTVYAGDESTSVWKLLVGYSEADARDRLTSLQLVELLRSNFVEVRELAIGQLEQLTGRRYDFRPLGSSSQREPGIQRWIGHVEREGALIKPQE